MHGLQAADSGCAKHCHLWRMCRDRCLKKRAIAGGGNCCAHTAPAAQTGIAIGQMVPSLAAALGMPTTYSALKKWSTQQGRTARHPLHVRNIIGTLHCGSCYEPPPLRTQMVKTSRGLQRAMHGTQVPPLHLAVLPCSTDGMPGALLATRAVSLCCAECHAPLLADPGSALRPN